MPIKLGIDLDTKETELKIKKLETEWEKSNEKVDRQKELIKSINQELESHNKLLQMIKKSGQDVSKDKWSIELNNRLQKANTELKLLEYNSQLAGIRLQKALIPKSDVTKKIINTQPFEKIKNTLPNIDLGFNKITSGLERFTNRVIGLAQRVFIFTVITQALRQLKEMLYDVAMTNDEFRISLAQIKGNLLTAFQPIWEFILPYLINFTKWLVTATSKIAAFFSALFGKSYTQSRENAKSTYTQIQANKKHTKELNKQSKAYDRVEKSAKKALKAKKDLSNFDELILLKGEKKLDELSPQTKIPSKIKTPQGIDIETPTINFDAPEVDVSNVENIGSNIRKFFTEDIPNFFQVTIPKILGINTQALSVWSEDTKNKITPIVESMSEKIKQGISPIEAFEQSLRENLGEKAPKSIEIFNGKLSEGNTIAYSMLETFEETFDEKLPVNFMNEFNKRILNGEDIVTAFGKAFVKSMTQSGNSIKKVNDDLDTTSDNIEVIGPATDPAVRGINNMNKVLSNIETTSNNAKQWITDNFNTAKDNVTKTWGNINEWFGEKFENIKYKSNILKDNIYDNFQKLKDKITELFSDPYGNIIKPFFNGIVYLVERLINKIISGINLLTSKLNLVGFDIPDWLGGGHFGINIPKLYDITLPRLATGAVIPPNSPFLAMLGDQKSGTNIEAPLETIKQAFKEALQENSINGNGNYTFVAQLDGRTIFEETVRQNDMYAQQSGRSAFAY